MRYFLAIEFDAPDDDAADDFLSDIVDDLAPDGFTFGHSCVRQLEERNDCPECDEPLKLQK